MDRFQTCGFRFQLAALKQGAAGWREGVQGGVGYDGQWRRGGAKRFVARRASGWRRV